MRPQFHLGKARGASGKNAWLVGGPGQGKTTVSQYLCQLHRVALLRDRADHLDPQVRDVIDAVEVQSRAEGIATPSARRYPVRIELSDLAPHLDEQTAAWAGSILSKAVDRPGVIRGAVWGARSRVKSAAALSVSVLAMTLLDGLPAEAWQARASAFDALDDVLRRQKSDLRSLPSNAEERWLQELPTA